MDLNGLKNILLDTNIGKDKLYVQGNEIKIWKDTGVLSRIKWNLLSFVGYYDVKSVANKIHSIVVSDRSELPKIFPYTLLSRKLNQLKIHIIDSESDLAESARIINFRKDSSWLSRKNIGLKLYLKLINKIQNVLNEDGIQLDVMGLFCKKGVEVEDELPQNVADNLSELIEGHTQATWIEALHNHELDNTPFMKYIQNDKMNLNALIRFILPYIVNRRVVAKLPDSSMTQAVAMLLIKLAKDRFVENSPAERVENIEIAWNTLRAELQNRAV